MSDNVGNNAEITSVPMLSDIPTPTEAITTADNADTNINIGSDNTETSSALNGCVIWHRKHLRTADHRALANAVADADVICPLFVFDPSFYDGDGLACDARIRLLHEAVNSLNQLYITAPAQSLTHPGAASHSYLSKETSVEPQQTFTKSEDSSTNSNPISAEPLQIKKDDTHPTLPSTLKSEYRSGLTIGYGDPVDILSHFADRGWSILTMATPTSRYGKRRDNRAQSVCGDALRFISGDGLIRDTEWSRVNWQDHITEWLGAEQHVPEWSADTLQLTVPTGITPSVIETTHDINPQKTMVPTGTHRAATTQLRGFVDQIGSYPNNISAPQDARTGTSGLSPYLNFGLLSIRQVYQYVVDNAPECRGRRMFMSRLIWNCHYNQKLADWAGWTDRAVNPAFEEFNADRHNPALVDAWKHGQTGFPMVDASMRCLRETGWLNFRMRAMCVSIFTHILQQPWWIGADWYHHHLIDSDVGINYTQWQSQAGLIGKPSQRVYNPRKQVRDHDPDGEWITKWVPELSDLPTQYLPRPERTPLAVQSECSVTIGDDYPQPIVEFDARRETFWSRYERRRSEAARELARPKIAKRASFSGGYDAARAIAKRYDVDDSNNDSDDIQLSFSEITTTNTNNTSSDDINPAVNELDTTDNTTPDSSMILNESAISVPTGTGDSAGEPSPDDREAVSDTFHRSTADTTDSSGDDNLKVETETDTQTDEQTTIGTFE
ncbi:cryptochrome/deoxyribodipyrimidine photo-lyase family protein [Haloquadratum walsbyi]|jgi:Deoxyribodipyrimidine photolyase|uniref:Deoxyribodipyrimidine photolyase n=1 Tax=Haloquadratum walsbyi J07HQW2 TaxID=1238425 RepID=U1PR13_9EURY|nr:cryptochrome/deoxyribodipyrimidine photo-lyase family protein [Haloquadratum walsbyi]ERG96212.1 MAG: deoxyribodipyrimidine photolyase [Haloquadratum walsbyi J07HQW2]